MAQLGNTNAAKGKAFRDALRYALKTYEDDQVKQGKALKAVAKTLVKKAIEGDAASIKEIADRLDGKPAQALVGSEGQPLIGLERVIVVQDSRGHIIEGEVVQDKLDVSED